MNAKHILVITICVVLPNGLYMSKASKSSKEKETFRKFVVSLVGLILCLKHLPFTNYVEICVIAN